MHHLGIDLGGTNIAAGVVTDDGALLSRVSIPTPRGVSCEAMAQAVAQAGQLAADAAGIPLSELTDCGLGTPGAVDQETGNLLFCSTFGYRNAPLGRLVSERLGLPVAVENDANAAACGEAACGAGQGADSLIMLTYGTGVGGGMILNGRLLTGCNGAAGELGHIVIRQGGKPCACGRRGCYERYASATALIEQTREAMAQHPASKLHALATPQTVTGRTAFDAADLGDETAQTVCRDYLENIACGLIDLVQIFQPDMVVLGGGICGQGEKLLAPIRARLDCEDYARDHTHRTRLAIAALGNDAGILGAALIRRFRR